LDETRRDDWDAREASALEDQRHTYDRMREQCPVAHSDFLGWSLFRHADIVEVLADPQTYSSASRHPAVPNGMDPPDHGRYRAALAPAFADERMDELEPRCREIARELIGPMIETGHAELMEAFATPFGLRSLCAFLGWPERLWECLGGWNHGNQQAAFKRDPAAGKALALLLAEHVKANLEQHRRAGHDMQDLTDALMTTEVDGQRLDDDQIVSSVRNWIAGEGTVAAGLSLIVLELTRDPSLQERLRADPSLIPAAIEEIMRVDGPLVANRRTTTREVELGGRSIPAGEPLTLMWIAANRDPQAFDAADTITLDRDRSQSLVWGQGIHLCMGAALARLQIRVALEELLRSTRQLAVAGEATRAIYPSNGLVSLPLSLS
jgi:cytochrome P450